MTDDSAAALRRYEGSCHCGAIRFAFESPVIERVTACNCSICAKKGFLHFRVPPESFQLLCGAPSLGTYQFGTRVAKHHFCIHCGIQVFTRPRAAPHLYTVNVRTLDGYDLEREKPEVVAFDGRHWEENASRLG